MKKLLCVLSSFILAANLYCGGIGFVDTQELLAKYPETKKVQDSLEKDKLELQKVLNEEKNKIAKLEEEIIAKGDKVSELEKNGLEKMKDDFKEKFQILQQELDKTQYQKFEKLRSDIDVAIKQISSDKELDIVLDKAVVFYGGKNITDEVLNFLSGVEKVDLSK